MQRAGSGGLAALVGALLPLLAIYAASYAVLPLARALINAKRNADIARGNAARAQAAEVRV